MRRAAKKKLRKEREEAIEAENQRMEKRKTAFADAKAAFDEKTE